MADNEEKILFKLIAEGNEPAFRAVYDLYFYKLASYAFKICKSQEAAKEIVQDVFIKLWQNRTKMLEVENYEAFLFTVARNKCFDYLRFITRQTDLLTNLENQISNNTVTSEDKINLEDLNKLIEEALSPLGSQKQKIFYLSKQLGYSNDEIADELQLAKSTVKNHLSQTIQYLKKYFYGSNHPSNIIIIIAIFLES